MPQGRCPAQPARMENLPNPEGSLPGPPCHRHLQTLQAESLCAATNDPLYQKNAMAPITKTPMAPHPNTGTNPTVTWAARTRIVASLHRCAASPLQMLSSSTWAEKESCIEVPSLAFCASSQRHQLSETDDQFSFICPTPNKTESGPHAQSASNDGRHFMTPFKMGLSRSFSIPSYGGVLHSSISPVTSVAG